MRTHNESIIQRHLYEGGRYEEDIDHETGELRSPFVTLYTGIMIADTCRYCGLSYPSKDHYPCSYDLFKRGK